MVDSPVTLADAIVRGLGFASGGEHCSLVLFDPEQVKSPSLRKVHFISLNWLALAIFFLEFVHTIGLAKRG